MTRAKAVSLALLLSAVTCTLCLGQTVTSASKPSTDAPKLRIAITFDDLPAHGSLPPGETRAGVATKIVKALQKAHVPPTYGFVNAVQLQRQPEDEAVMRIWRDGGNRFGNHTWSHPSLNQLALDDFQAEITRDEPALRQLSGDTNWHWFRFPFLAQGDTPEKQAGVRKFLLDHNYKAAGVTMSFADYLYNEPYARCSAKGDSKSIALLESTFMAAADESITYYRDLSHKLYGRDIPYVLLMHIGAFDARMLPQVLDLYRAKGFQFVTLEDAESDKFYLRDTDLRLPPGPDSLEGATAQRNFAFPPHAVPEPQFDNLCR